MPDPSKIKRIGVIGLALLTIVAGATGAEGLAATRSLGIKVQMMPPWLYHWIDASSLSQEWRLAALERSGRMPLPNMKDTFLIVQSVPDLEAQGGLFTWSHPVTGLGTGPTELYGDSVLMMEMVGEPVRVLELVTEEDSELRERLDLKSFDVIHHRRIYQGANDRNPERKDIIWEEYIITNNRVINGFTADPTIIRPRIAKQIARLKKGQKYAWYQLHMKVPGAEAYAKTLPFFNSRRDVDRTILPILENYLAMDGAKIPTVWRRPLHFGLCDKLREDY